MSHYRRPQPDEGARVLDQSLDIDSALDCYFKSKWKDKVNKMLELPEQPVTVAENKTENN